MRRIAVWSVGVVAALAQPAMAGVTELAAVGPWQAFHVSGDDGRSLCGISQSNGRLHFHIKFNNERMAFVHLGKTGWAVPADAQISIAFDVDGRHLLTLPFRATDNPSLIIGLLTPEQAAGLLDRFSLGDLMQIRFLTGSEGGWDVPLQGSYRITQEFLRCVTERLTASQPFEAALPGQTQPF